MLSPSLVILSEAKNLGISLRVNSAKDPALAAQGKLREASRIVLKSKTEILRCAQNDRPDGFFSNLTSSYNTREMTS